MLKLREEGKVMDFQHSSFNLLHFFLHPALTPEPNHTPIRSTLPSRGVSNLAIMATINLRPAVTGRPGQHGRLGGCQTMTILTTINFQPQNHEIIGAVSPHGQTLHPS